MQFVDENMNVVSQLDLKAGEYFEIFSSLSSLMATLMESSAYSLECCVVCVMFVSPKFINHSSFSANVTPIMEKVGFVQMDVTHHLCNTFTLVEGSFLWCKQVQIIPYIESGKKRMVIMKTQMPSDLLPTFRGKFLSVNYYLTLTFNSSINDMKKTHRIPLHLRVPVFKELIEISLNGEDDNFLQITNNYSTTNANKLSENSVDECFGFKYPNTVNKTKYIISCENVDICELEFQKKQIHIANEISVMVNFNELPNTRCFKFSATLACKEIVDQSLILPSMRKIAIEFRNVTSCNVVCNNMKNVEFQLSAPMNFSPSFHSKIVSVEWMIIFKVSTYKIPTEPNIFTCPKSLTEVSLPPFKLSKYKHVTCKIPITIQPQSSF